MDMNSVLLELDTWPLEEQMRLAQALWDRMAETGSGPLPTAIQMAELERRLDELDEHPELVVSWEEVQEYVRRPR